MNKKNMIIRLIDYYSDGNKSQFAKLMGVKPQTISSWLTRETLDTELIYAKCEGVSPEWLLTGCGEMLRPTAPSQADDVNLIITGHANVQASGNSNQVARPQASARTIDRVFDEIAEQRKLVQTAQAQIDRLLAVIEHLTKH